MQDEPKTALDHFNAFFTTRTLIMIIGLLMGVLVTRLLGVQ
jgi:hypothetical protein